MFSNIRSVVIAVLLSHLALCAQAQKVLTVAAYPAVDSIIKAALPAWEKKHPGVQVKVISRAYADHHTAMTTALSTSSKPPDVMVLESTPMDYLDFASPREGLAGKIGIDATNKIGAETTRDWGQVMALDPKDEAFAADLLARYLPGVR